MEKLINHINKGADKFRETINALENPFIRVITHYDTDGITSGAIIAKAFQRADIKFHITIVQQLEKSILENLIKEFKNLNEGILFFLDLSGDFELIKKINATIFILDHHEFKTSLSLPQNIFFVNPLLFNNSGKDEISGAGLTYLFFKRFDSHNKDLASLAVIGMIGDVLGHDISKINNFVLQDSNVEVRKGISMISATKPLNKALEFCTEIFIPDVTGNPRGAIEFLRDAGIKFEIGKNMLSLSQEELSKLVTAIVLRRINFNNPLDNSQDKDNNLSEDLLGNIYTMNFFNRTEDIRELSTLINACGRSDYGDIALGFCMGSLKSKEKAEEIYNERKKYIIEGLNYIKNMPDKISNNHYIIFNCKEAVKDSIIGTLLSILSFNFSYPPGMVLIGLAYRTDGKIKVSARLTGNKKSPINLRDILIHVFEREKIEGECGGHQAAAGCLIPINIEESFINALKQELNSLQHEETKVSASLVHEETQNAKII